MTTTLSTTTTNPHIAALETVFNESAKPIEWLVIAHNDPRMIQSLSSALNGRPAAILEVSQDTWNFTDGGLSETIEWALQQGEIKNLVLVGNSQAGGGESRASLAAQASVDAESGYAKLLAGVKRNNAQNRDAQKRFAPQVQQMSEIPVVHDRWSNDELAVYGLLYRAESGLFLAYDADADTFRPLVSH